MTASTIAPLSLIVGLFATSVCLADGCRLDHADALANIAYVYDGDTVLLNGQHKVRIIGLDTPELARGNSPAEPFADQARVYLQQLLHGSNPVKLRYDAQHKDRYQRDLAHLFLSNGDNIAKQLLEKGLATALIIPPNVLFADCYLAAQERARSERLGIWQLPEFQAVPLSTINPEKLPLYRLVTATVKGIRKGKRAHRITLLDKQQQLTLYIHGHERSLFNRTINQHLVGQKVLVQGWINKRQGHLQLQLRHPGFLKLLSDNP